MTHRSRNKYEEAALAKAVALIQATDILVNYPLDDVTSTQAMVDQALLASAIADLCGDAATVAEVVAIAAVALHGTQPGGESDPRDWADRISDQLDE